MDDDQFASCPEDNEEEDTSIHGFNVSNLNGTVIQCNEKQKANSCEGSDSGVEVVENVECTLQRTVSTNSQDFETVTVPSCDSSLVSCYSNYDETFNLLVRRNSTLLDDYKLRSVDGTSENGSESSSVVSTRNQSTSKRTISSTKSKRVTVEKKAGEIAAKSTLCKNKPPITPRSSLRAKSIDRTNGTPTSKPSSSNLKSSKPDSLPLKKDAQKKTPRTPSQTRSTLTTPTDDGRWPSNFSRPAPSMTRSIRGILPLDVKPKEVKNTLEKYATLPRRRKERLPSTEDVPKGPSRENSVSRVSVIRKQAKTLLNQSPVSRKTATKTKIYHETSSQTALNLTDIEKALQGIHFNPVNPQDVEKQHRDVQVDVPDERLAKLETQLGSLQEKYDCLKAEHSSQRQVLSETELALKQQHLENEGLKKELKNNNERVAAMLGTEGISKSEETGADDSLMVLETRLKNVAQVIIKQEEEISRVNEYCRALQMQHDRSLLSRDHLTRQLHDFEVESKELQEFMQMEKTSLAEELRESESESKIARNLLLQKENDLKAKEEEYKRMTRSFEQKRQEHLGLQARYTALEAKCRELLVHQGSAVSGAAVALTALVSRLEGLVDELVNSYNISEQELDDVIYHNEVYSNSSSSPDVTTPDKPRKFINEKSPSPKRGSSFVAAVISAIKNATAQTNFRREISHETMDNSDNSTELLDSETEPCLMMEHVLEDVVLPDSHSVNMISSGHSMISSLRMTRSDDFSSFAQSFRNRENDTSLSDLCTPVSLVDQVIEVDNTITRLLKVIRIIQLENEDYINELQDERDSYCAQVNTHRDTNKIVVKQLKDWESLGAKLKCEVNELLMQLSKKNSEIEELKIELNSQRKEVEKLNKDVCELSTALSKTELSAKKQEEEAKDALRNYEATGEIPPAELLGRLISMQREIPSLQEKLQEKEKELTELTQAFVANRQVLTESLKEAVSEVKKQYHAIDKSLEALHSVQPIVQQCPTLVKLQLDLEELSCQTASATPFLTPPDCNANAAMMQAIGEIVPPIDSSA